MRITSLLVLTLGTMLRPAFCQTTVSQPSTTNETPLLYAGAIATSADFKASLVEAEGGRGAVSPYIEPVAPALSAAERNPAQLGILQPKPKMKEWKLSLLALAAAHSADAATSWNKRELNPMLSPGGGAFGAQALAVKCAVSIGSLGLQAILLRNRPQLAKMFARLNFMETGIIGATAIHNSFVPGR